MPAGTESRGDRGLVVMAHGAPSSMADIEPYFTHIRRGRPPSNAELTELRRRYEAIGGASPLPVRTREQRTAIAQSLDVAEPGRWRVQLGYKHAPPFIEDAVAAVAAEGVALMVGLVLVPHGSRATVGGYHARAAETCEAAGVPYVGIEAWHDEPDWLDAMAQRLRTARDAMPDATKVLFTAHSLPERMLDGDPYPDRLWESAKAIAARAGLDRWYGWSTAWQSAGRTPEPWRGPDIGKAIGDLGATGRAAGVLVCPQGFVVDNLEILYDLDIAAARGAADVGLVFGRTALLNADPVVMAALAQRVMQTARGFATASAPAAPEPGSARGSVRP